MDLGSPDLRLPLRAFRCCRSGRPGPAPPRRCAIAQRTKESPGAGERLTGLSRCCAACSRWLLLVARAGAGSAPRSRSPFIRASLAATISRTPSSCCSGTLDATGERIDTSLGFTAHSVTPALLFGSVRGEVVGRGRAADQAQRPAIRAHPHRRSISRGDGGGRALARPAAALLQPQPAPIASGSSPRSRPRSACASRSASGCRSGRAPSSRA